MTFRNDYRHRLRCVAHKLDIEGGVILHQATPWVPWYNRPEQKRKIFAHVFTMAGVMDSNGVENVARVARHACDDQMLLGMHELMLLPGTTPQALRYLLYGSSYKFDSSRVGLLVKDPKTVLYGIQGAAALQPTFLFDEQQAWSYSDAMKGTRLYDTFGNWRESQAEQKSCPPKPRVQSECGEECRKWAFESENDRKHRDAEARRQKLAVIALPFYQKFKDAGGKRLGSPALRKSLSEAGHNITDRDARWLAKNLPSMDTPTVSHKFVARRKFVAGRKLEIARRRPKGLEQTCAQTVERGLGTKKLGRTRLSHAGIIQLYEAGMTEATRILKPSGLLLVKCQDEIESGRQQWSHIEVRDIACRLGMTIQDLFVVTPRHAPLIQNRNQKHARKNHSYMWVFKSKRVITKAKSRPKPGSAKQ